MRKMILLLLSRGKAFFFLLGIIGKEELSRSDGAERMLQSRA